MHANVQVISFLSHKICLWRKFIQNTEVSNNWNDIPDSSSSTVKGQCQLHRTVWLVRISIRWWKIYWIYLFKPRYTNSYKITFLKMYTFVYPCINECIHCKSNAYMTQKVIFHYIIFYFHMILWLLNRNFCILLFQNKFWTEHNIKKFSPEFRIPIAFEDKSTWSSSMQVKCGWNKKWEPSSIPGCVDIRGCDEPPLSNEKIMASYDFDPFQSLEVGATYYYSCLHG